MATRRMKRIKRTKKHLHHGRRKTNRRHLRNATRRGGMLKALAKKFASEQLNPKDGLLYGGIEVFKVMVDGKPRYYIGNRPLISYENSRDPDDKEYARKITRNLMGIHQSVAKGGPFDGVVYLDQDGFDAFKEKISAFDKRCVIAPTYVSFLGTRFEWRNHDIPLEITTVEFAQKNPRLMDFLSENVEKFVFFKTLFTHRSETKTQRLFKDEYDAIFLSIHFKKNKENQCALAKFKDKDVFNNFVRMKDKATFPHFLLVPDKQPGSDEDQANVATCYVGKYDFTQTGYITYEGFVNVIDQFNEYKKAGCDDTGELMGRISSLSAGK